jgi:hypothetical protein
MVVWALWRRERRERELGAWGASRALCMSSKSLLVFSKVVFFSFGI